jgi:nucleoside-diphosphate-sugar epimerase
MTIVVTGAGGFVGRVLVRQLLEAGHRVTAMDTAVGSIPAGARVVAGDLGAPATRAAALRDGCEALIHLATVPGGAAEADPAQSRRINIDAMYDLLLEAGAVGHRPRVVFASSIAVLGDTLPAHVDDATPLAPTLIYGGHKAMMEQAVTMFTNRGLIDGITLRLPGILARPKGPSGMKSAFMSEIFHALKATQPFVCPVSADATIWAQSVSRCAANLVHALVLDPARLPRSRAVTLPALRIRMGDLAAEIARRCAVPADLVSYAADGALEAAFGSQPALETPAALRAGFADDRDLASLVFSALATI